MLTAGVDLWLNTPRRPFEASGTSGMKAALNGVPSLSVLDRAFQAALEDPSLKELKGRIEPLRTAWPIRYREDYPTLELTWPSMTSRAFTDVCILTKSLPWHHEQEYRLISPIEGEESEVTFEGEVGTLLPGSVTGLTLGALMPEKTADGLTRIAFARGLPVWRAQRSEHEYRLMFQRIRKGKSS